jgi:hypothetical protein
MATAAYQALVAAEQARAGGTGDAGAWSAAVMAFRLASGRIRWPMR